MAILHISVSEKLAQAIEEVAKRENRPLDDIAGEVLEDHFLSKLDDESQEPAEDVNPLAAITGILDYDITDMSTTVKESGEQVSALDALMGMFDDDVTDMSTTVKETMREYYKNKKWKS